MVQNLPLTRQAEKALKTTFLEAKLFQSPIIRTPHLLLCILRNDNDPISGVMAQFGASYDAVKSEYQSNYIETETEEPKDDLISPSMSYGDADSEEKVMHPLAAAKTHLWEEKRKIKDTCIGQLW